MRNAFVGLFLFTAFALTQPALGQQPTGAPPGQRIVTRTRLVTQFSDLEANLADAIRMNDGAALDRLLSADFEVWTPEPPGHPIPRQDWLSKFRQSGPQMTGYGQFAAKDFGGPVMVNFVMTQRSAGKPAQSFFVVDVWTKGGAGKDQWQITDRYLAPVRVSKPASHPTPTGKE
jgi:hypothetical protein